MDVVNGSADVTTYFVLRDSTNHVPKTDITITDIDLYYMKQGAAMAAKVDATALAAADSAHADNKAFHCGQGLYRVDWPDAAFDGGVGKTVQLIVVCTGVDTTFLEVELKPVAQTGDSYAIVNHADYGNAKLVRSTTPENTLTVGATGLVAVPDTQKVDVETVKTKAITCADAITVLASVGTAATSTAQTGDSFDKVNDATIGLANLKALIDAMQADIGDASASTLGSLYAILGNATAAIAGRLPAALESGNMPVHVKAQDNIDFGALQKASITAAVPTASAIGTDAASKVLVTPAQKLVTDANGYVTYSNAAPPSADDVKAAMEADGSKLDHLWEMTEDDGGTRRLTANALEEAPSGTGLDAAGVRAAIGMADADLDTQLAALPTAAENADAVWDEALSGHAGAGTAGAGLSAAGSAGDPWSTLLPGAYGAGTAGYLIGNLAPAGGSVWTYTVTLPDGTTPVADVIVRVCTDIAGTNVIRSSVTNSSGIATFYLQPGTYYIFCEKDGYNFSTYDTEVVS